VVDTVSDTLIYVYDILHTLWFIVRGPVAWLLDNGDKIIITPPSTGPSPGPAPNFYGFPKSSHPKERLNWMVSLGLWVTEPKVSIFNIIIGLFFLGYFWSVKSFSGQVIPGYGFRIAQDWIAALGTANSLVWSVTFLSIHSLTFGWFGSLEVPLTIFGAQLRRSRHRNPSRLADYLLAWAAWCESRHGHNAITLWDLFITYVQPSAVSAAEAFRRQCMNPVERWLYEQRFIALGLLENLGKFVLFFFVGVPYGACLGTYRRYLYPLYLAFDQHRILWAERLYPASVVDPIQKFWKERVLEHDISEQIIFAQAANMSIHQRMDICRDNEKLQAQMAHINKTFIPELGGRCKAYRNSIHALIHYLNWHRRILDMINTANWCKATGHSKPPYGTDVVYSHKFYFSEDQTKGGFNFTLTDDTRFNLHQWAVESKKPRYAMRYLASGGFESWLRHGRHVNFVPELFVDFTDTRRNPWKLEAIFPGFEFPAYQPFQLDKGEHVKMINEVEEACAKGQGIEIAKQLEYIPKWAIE
jgi:hypothetical protein